MICIIFMPIGKKEPRAIPLEKLDEKLPAPIKDGVNHFGVAMVAVLDVFGQVVLTVGLFYIGSGLYQVIYSSVIVFAAIYNRIFLKRSMSKMTWAAVFFITFGLALTSIGKQESKSSMFSQAEMAQRTGVGFVITMLGTAIFSGCYTLNDALMTGTSTRATPRDQCLWVGIYSTAFCLILMLCISIPTLLTMPVCLF